MNVDFSDLNAFLAVAKARGFREAARTAGASASTLSEAVRRLEAALDVRLLHRTTRSVTPTEAGARLLERLAPALGEVASALDTVNELRDGVSGTLRLNVPVSAARLVLPAILPASSPLTRACGWKSSPRMASSTCSLQAATPAFAMTSGWSRT